MDSLRTSTQQVKSISQNVADIMQLSHDKLEDLQIQISNHREKSIQDIKDVWSMSTVVKEEYYVGTFSYTPDPVPSKRTKNSNFLLVSYLFIVNFIMLHFFDIVKNKDKFLG